jgi:glycine dehydrogenase subunit 1
VSYIPHTDADRRAMLQVIGVETIEDLFCEVPGPIRLTRDLNLPPALDELSLIRHLEALAAQNVHADSYLCFLGAGIYDHFIPTVVELLASRGEFATAYTPYQPEMSQGILQALYEYQSLICNLTGMDLANASMYDASTAMAEAALMATEFTGRQEVIVSRTVHPNYRAVLRTYLHSAGYILHELDYEDGILSSEVLPSYLSDHTACLVIQHPNFFGCLEDMEGLHNALQKVGALSVVCVDPIALGLIKPPGEYGADIVVGEGQSLGCPMGFGGPLLGFFACKSQYLRKFPGRIVGATTDTKGRRGFTMTLRTREQDIRREKATSNICTNETLLALAATIYLSEMGKQGLQHIADLCLQKAHYAQEKITQLPGVKRCFQAPFFKEFAIRFLPKLPPSHINRELLTQNIIGGYELGQSYPELSDSMLLCVTETKTKHDIDCLIEALGKIMG